MIASHNFISLHSLIDTYLARFYKKKKNNARFTFDFLIYLILGGIPVTALLFVGVSAQAWLGASYRDDVAAQAAREVYVLQVLFIRFKSNLTGVSLNLSSMRGLV